MGAEIKSKRIAKERDVEQILFAKQSGTNSRRNTEYAGFRIADLGKEGGVTINFRASQSRFASIFPRKSIRRLKFRH